MRQILSSITRPIVSNYLTTDTKIVKLDQRYIETAQGEVAPDTAARGLRADDDAFRPVVLHHAMPLLRLYLKGPGVYDQLTGRHRDEGKAFTGHQAAPRSTLSDWTSVS